MAVLAVTTVGEPAWRTRLVREAAGDAGCDQCGSSTSLMAVFGDTQGCAAAREAATRHQAAGALSMVHSVWYFYTAAGVGTSESGSVGPTELRRMPDDLLIGGKESVSRE